MLSDDDGSIPPSSGRSTIQDRIAAFDMLDRMPDATKGEKISRLSLVGFAVAEIAAMLQTTPAAVRQAQYESRKKIEKPKAAKAVK